MKLCISPCVPLNKNTTLKVLLLLSPIIIFQLFVAEKWALHCRFADWTGLPCPSCGTTRSLQLLLEGHLAAAWQMQPLAFCTVTLLGALFIYSILGSIFKWPGLRIVLSGQRERWAALLLAATAVFGNWVYLIFNR